VGWVEFCRDGQMFDCFLKIASFLEDLVPHP
jgi:hypothetical protein